MLNIQNYEIKSTQLIVVLKIQVINTDCASFQFHIDCDIRGNCSEFDDENYGYNHI